MYMHIDNKDENVDSDLKTAGYQENEDENDDSNSITSGYQKVDCIRFNTDVYGPNELNRIILRTYKEKYVFKECLSDNNYPKVKLHIFQKQTTKIVLFETVTDCDNNDPNLALLDSALEYYVRVLQQYKSEDILIIPVAELTRRHFRLLTVTNKAIYYYDSKSLFISKSIRTLAPIIPAASIVFDEVRDEILEVLSELRKAQTENKEINYSKILTLMGKFMYRTAEKYPDWSDLVFKTCNKYFPELSFYEYPLANQTYNEYTDCGPLTAAYAEQAVDGHPDVKENIIQIRARYEDGEMLDQATTVKP